MKDFIENYLKELERTTGKQARIEKHGSWYRLFYDASYHSYRKNQIISMTENLKLKPNVKQ